MQALISLYLNIYNAIEKERDRSRAKFGKLLVTKMQARKAYESR